MKFDISQMLCAEVYDHSVRQLQLIETHISWVVLTGDFAYKIKKPVNFGFLDFTSRNKRHVACLQELALNRRTAPELYIDVVSIRHHQGKLQVSDRGILLESAVKMVQFPQSAQLDNRLRAGRLTTHEVEAIAEMVANFHQVIESAGPYD
ncbi:MAG: aminoglycoside phosphotransferase, partial [Gammaproteobacteria bacterium]|nr:aminoglycoside phosphotransferase [Gammaproteobacteria bacterium]